MAPSAYISLLSVICTYFSNPLFLDSCDHLPALNHPSPRENTASLTMAVPCNIRGSASQLFYQDHQSPQYQALLAITELPHPDRSILVPFLIDSQNPQAAARYLLRETTINGTSQSVPTRTIWEFLSDWKYLVSMCKDTITKSNQVCLVLFPNVSA